MTTMTSAEMLAAGWKRRKEVWGAPSLVSPDGTTYRRCITGMPDLCLVGDSGTKHYLRRVEYRSARSLLRLMHVPGPSYGAP